MSQLSCFIGCCSGQVCHVFAGDEAKKTFGAFALKPDEFDARQLILGIDIQVDVTRAGLSVPFDGVVYRGRPNT